MRLRTKPLPSSFRRFKDLADHCGLIDEWYAFRDRAMEDIAAEWLEANGIEYEREEPSKGGNDAG